MILQPRDDGGAGIDLDVPTQSADLLGSGVQDRLGVGWFEPSRGIGFEIEPHATDTRARHLLQRLARGSLVDDGNAAGARAHAAHSVEGAGIVGTIDARLHDHDAIEVKVALEFEQLLYRSLRGRIDAPFCKGKRGRIAEHVHVAIARAARDSEINRGAAGGGDRGPRPHHPGGAGDGTRLAQHCASCQHGVVLPYLVAA